MDMKDMREKIKIKQEVEFSGPVPPLDPDYETIFNPWAKVEFLKGQEFWAAKGVNSEHTVRFITRMNDEVDTTMVVEYKGKDYDIQGVMPLTNHNRYMIILCKRVESGGW